MCEDDCRAQLETVRSWLSDEHYDCATWLVSGYVSGFGGARFDKLASETPADTITEGDLNAVRALSIRFPRAFVQYLEQDNVRRHFRQVLMQIPSDAVLEDLSNSEFDQHLGLDSFAWEAWEELSGSLRNAKARAPLVGASKLLAAKRLRLVPLEDSYVRRTLKTSRRDIWKVIHCIVRDPQVRAGLGQVRRDVPAASHLTLHRVLDIIAWRKHQGHCCPGEHQDRRLRAQSRPRLIYVLLRVARRRPRRYHVASRAQRTPDVRYPPFGAACV